MADSRLESRGLGGSDVKGFLEVLVQDVEKTICKAPHEEQNGDERYLEMSMVVSLPYKCRHTGMIDCFVVISPAPVTA